MHICACTSKSAYMYKYMGPLGNPPLPVPRVVVRLVPSVDFSPQVCERRVLQWAGRLMPRRGDVRLQLQQTAANVALP